MDVNYRSNTYVFSIFIASNSFLEYNIKNHTYIVKGSVSGCNTTDTIKIDNKNYIFDPEYMTEPFIKTNIRDLDKVEIIAANGIFHSYIIKVNKDER